MLKDKNSEQLLFKLKELLEQLPEKCKCERLRTFISMVNKNLYDNGDFGYCIYCGREGEDEVENE
ncbi:MAG: hypothetical protein IKG27_06410 [Bacilli bacterium]|nr:hypothetical protein [Bacilli bacterium]